MKVHLFGATSSPTCAVFALRCRATDNSDKFEREVNQQFEKNSMLMTYWTTEYSTLGTIRSCSCLSPVSNDSRGTRNSIYTGLLQDRFFNCLGVYKERITSFQDLCWKSSQWDSLEDNSWLVAWCRFYIKPGWRSFKRHHCMRYWKIAVLVEGT